MAHKIFISYKYNESLDLKDNIVRELGEDAKFYRGERPNSKDMSDFASATIKKHLSDMLFDTTITIVVLSPNMMQSDWINWEVEHSIRKETRNGIQSQRNVIILVTKKDKWMGYNWLDTHSGNSNYLRILEYLGLYRYYNNELYIYDKFIEPIKEEDFLHNIKYYIEKAFNMLD